MGGGNGYCAQCHGGNNRVNVGFKEVGTHAGDVTDIITDKVSDDGGVARVILGYACLDLTYDISAGVGSFGEYAAADSGEDGY